MELEKSSKMENSVASMKFLKKDQTPFQKRIASIALKTGDEVTDWMNSDPRRNANPKTPRYGLRRYPPKFPSPYMQPFISDSPSTMTTGGSTSRSTYVTLRGSSITPYKSLLSETPYQSEIVHEDPKPSDEKNKPSYELAPLRTRRTVPFKSHTSLGKPKGMFKEEIPQHSESAPLERNSWTFDLSLKFRHMPYTNRTRTSAEDDDFNINPEPVPYQPQNFLQSHLPTLGTLGKSSSTLLKKVPIPKRHLDSFGGYEYSLGSKRGVILHTDRYQKDGALRWDAAKSLEGLSQRDRLRVELEYMERLRGIKRRREMLPHRAQLDLLMGGKKVEFAERFDLQREIQKLKSLILPKNARDLFHGRGFQLPDQHSSVHPRRPPTLDYDSDEDISASAPASLQRFPKYSIDPDTGLPKSNLRQNAGHLPQIRTKGNVLGLRSSSPILMAREKRTVDQIKARISMPAEQRGRRPITIKLHDMVQGSDRFSEEGPWNTNIIRQGASAAYLKRSRTNIQSKYESIMSRSHTVPDGQEKHLKVSSKMDNVKRVDIATPDPPQKGKKSGKSEQNAAADYNTQAQDDAKLEIPVADAQDISIAEDVETERKHVPTPVSDDSRRTGSPRKAITPNPLKGSELQSILPEDQRDELKAVFKKLDTDDDGHVMYNQLKTQLPKQLTENQERFLKQVYDITSSSTFFGIDEFMTMSTLSKTVNELGEDSTNAFSKLDFSTLHENILEYVDRFQTVDRGQRGKISLESLQEILSVALEADLSLNEAVWNKIVETIDPSEGVQISKIEYLANIPFFLSLKS